MIMTIGKNIFRIKTRFFRYYSLNIDPTISNTVNENIHALSNNNDIVVDQNWDHKQIRRDTDKSLRIAILGLPNVGKSTLVNRLVGRPVCGMSSKVHTTKTKTDAIYIEDDTQLIFIDTPGLVTNRDFTKFKLDPTFKSDIDKSLKNCDIVGVVQDASHPFKSNKIDERIMVCLEKLEPNIRSILILNKIDKLKNKKKLLELVDVLTGNDNWPNFSDVFMVSALKDDGVIDIRNYLLDMSESRDWEYDSKTITNTSPEKIATEIVRSKFMDSLPQELPYSIGVGIEHYGTLPDGSMSIVVSVRCPTDRISKIVMGKHGSRVKIVALQSEQELSQVFKTTVRLKIAIKFSDKNEFC